MLLRNLTEQASKTSVSCEASSKFHRTMLPKRTFRARLPEQASKTNVSCEASFKFPTTKLPKRTFRAMLPTISIENLRFATVSCHRSTESYERVHPAKAKCASRYNGVPFHISKSTFYYSGVRKNVWIKRRKPGATRGIQKSPFYHSFGHLTSTKWREGSPSKSQICISPQFWTSDEHETTRGLRRRASKFAFHLSFGRPMSTKRREGCDGELQNSHFTSVLDVRWARNDERVATASFKIRISPQFWTSDEHETTRGLRRRASKFAFHLSFGCPMSTKWREGCDGELQNSHFTSVLDVRWARSDERVVSRLDRPNPPCVKKERNFKEVLIHNHSQQIFSADFFSRSSQQIFSADFLQQIFSADLLSRSSQQIFSADFSADLLSRFSQQIFSADLLSRSSQQIFSADFLSRSSQQIFSADLLIVLSFAVVRGWWSAIVLSFAVVRGWWSAIVLSCWWSILHEFFRRTLSRSFREKKNIQSESSCDAWHKNFSVQNNQNGAQMHLTWHYKTQFRFKMMPNASEKGTGIRPVNALNEIRPQFLQKKNEATKYLYHGPGTKCPSYERRAMLYILIYAKKLWGLGWPLSLKTIICGIGNMIFLCIISLKIFFISPKAKSKLDINKKKQYLNNKSFPFFLNILETKFVKYKYSKFEKRIKR